MVVCIFCGVIMLILQLVSLLLIYVLQQVVNNRVCLYRKQIGQFKF